MPYFNRLTDIVTCNLTALLQGSTDPAAALSEVIAEIREGIAGAERCVSTAARNAARIESEIDEQRQSIGRWTEEARQQLASGQEDKARQSLFRKREVADLVSALEEQYRAATATRDHLTTTLNALQARLVDAQRRLSNLESTQATFSEPNPDAVTSQIGADEVRCREVDAELEDLRNSIPRR